MEKKTMEKKPRKKTHMRHYLSCECGSFEFV